MKLLLIRHGEPCYETAKELGLVAYVGDLTPNGIAQAEILAKDERLKDADAIICSPFTRTIQTAAIILKEIAKKREIPFIVEPALHEWLADTTHKDTFYCDWPYFEFLEHGYQRRYNSAFHWEGIDHVADRVYPALKKYLSCGYDKVIVVTHAMVIRTLGYTDQNLPHCCVFEREFDENSAFKHEEFVPWRK